MSISANQEAPVLVRVTEHIDAPIEVVWALLSDIGGWPSWDPGVATVSLDGPVEVGTAFTWKAGPGSIRSTLLEVEAPGAIAWSGATMGIRAVHTYRLTTSTAEGGGVDVETEESWDGLPPRLLAGPLRKALEKALRASVGALKARAEKPGDAADPR